MVQALKTGQFGEIKAFFYQINTLVNLNMSATAQLENV